MVTFKRFGQKYWPLLTLGFAPLILFAPVIAGRVWYWGVPLLQFYPWQRLAVEAYRAGQLPLWNPWVGSGAPLAANLQTGAFYPLNFLSLLLPTEQAMGYTATFHVILAGLFMYAYLRALRLSPLAACLGALAFELNGFLIARAAFLSVTAAVPWLAAWLWRAEKLHSASRLPHSAFRNALWLALAIGLGILAGHAQTAVYGLIFVTIYFAWRTFTVSPYHRVTRSSLFSLVIFAGAVLLGLGLAAIQLLPAAELTRESQRAGGLDYTKIMTHSFWPLRLLTLLSPDFFGNPAFNNFWGYDNYWENAAYIGVAPLLLAGYAVWDKIKTRKRLAPGSAPIGFLAVSAVVALLLALGWFTLLYPFLYQFVPGFNLFQGPARWLIVMIVALCALAGCGTQVVIERGVSRRATTRLIFLGLALSLGGLAASVVLKGRVETFGPATLRLGTLLLLTGLLFRADRRRARTQAALVAVVAIDLITAHFLLNPTLPPEIYHAPNPTAVAIEADGSIGRVYVFAPDEEVVKFEKYLAHDTPDRGRQFDGFGPTDLNYWLGERAALLPNAAQIDGVPTANNFDSLIVGRYQALLDRVEALPLPDALTQLGLMHVGYIASPRDLPLPIVYRTPDMTIYRNPAVRARAWIAPEGDDAATVPDSQVESLTDSINAVTIRAASPQGGWLILADTHYPGWQAFIDGVPTEIRSANEAFRAVKFPAGSHTITFRYEPRSVLIGLIVSLWSAGVIAFGLMWAWWQARR